MSDFHLLARLVVLSKGAGDRHAEAERNCVDFSEATWTVYEDTSKTCSVFSSNRHPLAALCDWTCASKGHDGHGIDAQCSVPQSFMQNQPSPLSSGESEFYGIVKCPTVGLGSEIHACDPCLHIFGKCADVAVRTDSSSGLALGSHRGLSRQGHAQPDLRCQVTRT